MSTTTLSEYLLDRLAQIGIEVNRNPPFPPVQSSTEPIVCVWRPRRFQSTYVPFPRPYLGHSHSYTTELIVRARLWAVRTSESHSSPIPVGENHGSQDRRMGWGMVCLERPRAFSFGADVTCSVMNSTQPTQPMGTPALNVCPDAYRPRPSKSFQSPLSSTASSALC